MKEHPKHNPSFSWRKTISRHSVKNPPHPKDNWIFANIFLWYIYCIIDCMIRILLTLIISLFFIASPVLGSELIRVSRVPSKDLIQLYFYFDAPSILGYRP